MKQSLRARIDSLEHQLFVSRAQDVGTMANARRNIDRAGDRLMASACIVTIRDLSGKIIVDSFAVTDGLSEVTIACIKGEIDRTIQQRLALNGIK